MKCPKCKGCGMMDVDDGIFTIHGYDCDYCLGTGYIEPMTNEEWFCGLSTEDKAEVLYKFYCDGRNDELQRYVSINEKSFVDWLKQPHKGE